MSDVLRKRFSTYKHSFSIIHAETDMTYANLVVLILKAQKLTDWILSSIYFIYIFTEIVKFSQVTETCKKLCYIEIDEIFGIFSPIENPFNTSSFQ